MSSGLVRQAEIWQKFLSNINGLSGDRKIPSNIKDLQVGRTERVIVTDNDEPLIFDAATRRAIQGCGRLGCTEDELAGMLQVSAENLKAFFRRELHAKVLFNRSRMEGKVSLRRIQYSLAPKSAAMAIFLGKNELGQSDRQDIQHSGGMDVVVRVTKYEDPAAEGNLLVVGPGKVDDDA